jgi:hypothetical protein
VPPDEASPPQNSDRVRFWGFCFGVHGQWAITNE